MNQTPEGVVITQPTCDSPSHEEKRHLPAGLQEISSARILTIKQNVDVRSLLCCSQRPNSYSIYCDDDHEAIITAREVNQCFARQCLGAGRGTSIRFTDKNDEDLGFLERPLTCSRGCCGCVCCLPRMSITAPPAYRIAEIKERRTCCTPRYDAFGQTSMTFSADCCYLRKCLWFHDVNFTVTSVDGDDVAMVEKKTYHNSEELLGLENNFTIQYLKDLSFANKMMVIGVAFLLNMNYFDDEVRYCF